MIDAIFNRVSVRSYTNRAISQEDLHTILRAAMAGPTCVNARDWSFLVVTDREMLNKMADVNGEPAKPLRTAAAAILIIGDTSRAFPPAKDYWIIDGAIAGQNIVLAAQDLGIGSVWLGTWPQMDRVEGQAKLFDLPEDMVPHSIIALGYAAKEEAPKPDFEEDRVHYETW